LTTLQNNPSNPNPLVSSNWRFAIKRSPNLNFTVQRTAIPGVTLDAAFQPNPFVQIPLPGDHIRFDHLFVTFRVDEDLNNYLEVLSWIFALGFPNKFDEFKNIAEKPKYIGENIYSDLSVTLLSSQRNPNVEFIFKDAWPVGLSEITMNVMDHDTTYPICTAAFAYTSFSFHKV